MEFNNKKIEIFPTTMRNHVSMLFRIKATLDRKDIIISIVVGQYNNYINNELANELMIPKTKMTKKETLFEQKTIHHK